MTTRKRISRPAPHDTRVYTRAGEGPGDSPFADVPEKKRQAMIDELRRQDAAFRAEREEREAKVAAGGVFAAIRHGVKSERDTQPVQVRMLKSQSKVLKQVAEQEDRSSSDVIRDLVDAYIAHCLATWPEGPRLDILRATLRAEEYTPSQNASAEQAVKNKG